MDEMERRYQRKVEFEHKEMEAEFNQFSNDELIAKIKLGSEQWRKMNAVKSAQHREIQKRERDEIEWIVRKMYAILAGRLNSRVGWTDDQSVLNGKDAVKMIEYRRNLDADKKEMEAWNKEHELEDKFIEENYTGSID